MKEIKDEGSGNGEDEKEEEEEEDKKEEKDDRPPLRAGIRVEVVKKATDGSESRSSNILAILTVRDAGQS